MAIYISHSPRHIQTCGDGWDEYHHANGRFLRHHPPTVLEFRPLLGAASDWIRDEALKAFGKTLTTGLADGVDPASRISMYDTDMEAKVRGWDDEKKQVVEEVLDRTSGYVHVRLEIPKTPRPWPGYDDIKGVKGNTAAAQIVQLVKDTGSNVHDTIKYERENANRQSVVEALEELLAAPGEPAEEELVSA